MPVYTAYRGVEQSKNINRAIRAIAVQNTSHAVMAQRVEANDSLDDFPTPPWATRALAEHVLKNEALGEQTCLEPACGRGYMASALEEYFRQVRASDVHDYGYGSVVDFTQKPYENQQFDWVITNPPFRLAEQFIGTSLRIARKGVAMLTRTVFIESVGRYDRLFRENPPWRAAQFTERVPMVKGRLDKKASTATGYAWIVWKVGQTGPTELFWIPPTRKALEREGDYDHSRVVVQKAVRMLPSSREQRVTQRDFFGG
jgi:hypothetical protein